MKRVVDYLVAIASVALTGCVSAESTYLENGSRGYFVDCSAWTVEWTSCLTKAGRLCKSAGFNVSFADELERLLIVECKRPDRDGRSGDTN